MLGSHQGLSKKRADHFFSSQNKQSAQAIFSLVNKYVKMKKNLSRAAPAGAAQQC